MKEEFMQMKMQEQQEARDIMEKHHPIGQERYVDEAEHERNEIIDAMHNIAQQPSINQLNNQMAKKTMQEKLQKQPEPIQETRREVLTRLYKENGLVKEDTHKDPRGFSTIARSGIDKIAAKNGITIGYEVILLDVEKGECVLKAAATMKVGNEVKNVMSFGEASVTNNLTGGGKKWLVSMAEKRAMGRVVLKLAGFYAQGMYSQDEMAFEMNE
jgi:hypothetical protein